MLLYGLALTPLATTLRQQFPSLIQPWYADDNAACGKATELKAYLQKLQELGLPRGYFPEQTKSILIPHPNLDRQEIAKILGDLGLIFSDGHRYLGGFIGSQQKKEEWIQEQTIVWSESISTLSRAAKRYPQSAYAAFTRSIQSEWTYLQ